MIGEKLGLIRNNLRPFLLEYCSDPPMDLVSKTLIAKDSAGQGTQPAVKKPKKNRFNGLICGG